MWPLVKLTFKEEGCDSREGPGFLGPLQSLGKSKVKLFRPGRM